VKGDEPLPARLPQADRVVIEQRKVRGYLLSPAHPVGRFKARVFAALGFDARTVDAFVEELRRIAATGQVASVEEIEFGRKYTVVGELRGPAGAARVLTVWIQEVGRADVRLVTVRPRWP
jgi:hypothetical protein